jgi:D-tyrosyl-tRNA(Tyr) deacylase
MKVVIQRASESSVTIESTIVANIKKGLLVLLGIEHDDDSNDVEWLCGKIANLRIFNDDAGVMNININEVGGEIIVVSQFTLHASTKKGNRPSYIYAASPDVAIPLYNSFLESLQLQINTKIQTGVFGADMKVQLINDGPVTIIIDSKNKV